MGGADWRQNVVMELAKAMEASSSYVITKCVTTFSTLLNNHSPLTEYVENPSSTRAT